MLNTFAKLLIALQQYNVSNTNKTGYYYTAATDSLHDYEYAFGDLINNKGTMEYIIKDKVDSQGNYTLKLIETNHSLHNDTDVEVLTEFLFNDLSNLNEIASQISTYLA